MKDLSLIITCIVFFLYFLYKKQYVDSLMFIIILLLYTIRVKSPVYLLYLFGLRLAYAIYVKDFKYIKSFGLMIFVIVGYFSLMILNDKYL